jgi:hypothetical protein
MTLAMRWQIGLDAAAGHAIFPPTMKAIFSLLVCVLTVPADPPQQTLTGKVLVLENENTLSGDVEKVGSQYRVRRALGETWVPASKALYLCASIDEAYAFVHSRANLSDPDERVRLARWCKANGLLSQAIAEAKAAVQLRPADPEGKRLLAYLEEIAVVPTSRAPKPPITESPSLNVDLTAECLGTFISRVQPVLMNTCAHCHTQSYPGVFKLTRAYEGQANRKSVQQNLAAVLAQVNFAQPQMSPLLTKAVSDHAHVGQAPLRGRQVAAYRMLEEWVRLTLENNPQLHEQLAPGTAPTTAAAHADSVWGEENGRPPAPPGPAAGQPMATPPSRSTADPYDPDEFNRQSHPDKPRRP